MPKSNKSNISSCAWKSMACWKNTRMDQPCPHGGGAGLWTKKAKATSWWLFYLDVIKFSLKWRWKKDDDIIVDDIIVDDIIVVDNIIRNLTTWLVARIVWLNILASLPCRLCFTGYNYSKLSLWYTVQKKLKINIWIVSWSCTSSQRAQQSVKRTKKEIGEGGILSRALASREGRVSLSRS